MRPRPREKAVLVALLPRGTPRSVAEDHLDELERLLDTAGGEEVARFLPSRPTPDAATYIGRGAVEEIGRTALEKGAALVLFDDELTPAQARNLEERWGGKLRVLDRPGLILDVFARHARSREARTQVELAQLQYLLPRLAGRYEHLSRLAGGIGTRGAGEQKLELDRRKIRDRIARLRRELQKIDMGRAVRKRARRRFSTIAISGYTNAGKTSLFNRLTLEQGEAADRLFATLDARLARARSPRLSEVLFIDTVGFVRKLPPSLVASFRSTLAEVRDADLVLHVVDASSPRSEEERQVAQEVLDELGVPPERTLLVWNKVDVAGPRAVSDGISVSAREGTGLSALVEAIEARLHRESVFAKLRIPYSDGREIAAARARFRQRDERDDGEALVLTVSAEPARIAPFRRYLVPERARLRHRQTGE